MTICGITTALGLASITLDDLEALRIATENRYRTATSDDVDNEGLGLPEDDPDVALLAAMLDQFDGLERKAVLRLEKAMRAHPLGPWVAAQKGIGLKQAARLLAVIGDPYWNYNEDRPRSVAELWAYAGFHVVGGVAPKRQRGKKANWSEAARKRMRMISESCLKAKGPYADVYYNRREWTDEMTHDFPCVRCGPAGKPARIGSPLSNGHLHADALRYMSKRILKDMWKEARRIHGQEAQLAA